MSFDLFCVNMVSLRLNLLFTLICFLIINQTYSKNDRKTYIVYMGDHPKGMDPESLPSLHATMAQKVLGSEFEPEGIIHSYKKSFNGFVVKLTEEEAENMAEMDNVVSVFPNKKNRLRTTRSWDFIGLTQKVKRSNIESDIIVGVIDSGIWPESKSFSDEGFGPPPKKWKGSCHNFTCNNKIVGAKYFNMEGDYSEEDIISPRDVEGHGTHTASTVAGNLVDSASLLGFASGTARGGVPSARIAVYKVCWKEGCGEADTLQAFDEAIADGVDIISISTGPSQIQPKYFQHSIDIGSFHAMKRGILTSNAAGNSGPRPTTMTNFSPWLLSVAATSMDRKFLTKVQLGNGKVYQGVTLNTFDLGKKMFPLVLARDVPNTKDGFNSSQSRFCYDNTLDRESVKGKIVLCEGFYDSEEVGSLSGAVGMLVGSNLNKDIPPTFALPSSYLGLKNIHEVFSYKASTSNATATIFRSTEFNDSVAPYVPYFSSRGPNPISPNTLKPDLAAPGVNILAAFSPLNPISEFKGDKRGLPYNIICGTSMSCPHASAAAAFVKSFHPNWSAAMIKSALMTTATPISPALNSDFEFAYGAGQINPVKATNPGLVYDIGEADYVKFLCGEGFTDTELRILTKDHSNCSKSAKKEAVYDLNLPSFALNVNVSLFSRVFHRTVTNVGKATSTYKAKVVSPSLLDIQVKPNVLSFTSIGQKKSYSVIIEGTLNAQILSASLLWSDSDDTFQVRSPIVVYGKH